MCLLHQIEIPFDLAGGAAEAPLVVIVQQGAAVLKRVPGELGHRVVLGPLGGPMLRRRVHDQSQAAVLGQEAKVLDGVARRHGRQAAHAAGIPEQIRPIHEVRRLVRPGLPPGLLLFPPGVARQWKMAHEVDNDVFLERRRDRRGPGGAVSEAGHVRLAVADALLQPARQHVPKLNVAVCQRHIGLLFAFPVQGVRRSLRMVPSAAVFAHAPARAGTVVLGRVEYGARGIRVQRLLCIGPPLSPHARVGFA